MKKDSKKSTVRKNTSAKAAKKKGDKKKDIKKAPLKSEKAKKKVIAKTVPAPILKKSSKNKPVISVKTSKPVKKAKKPTGSKVAPKKSISKAVKSLPQKVKKKIAKLIKKIVPAKKAAPAKNKKVVAPPASKSKTVKAIKKAPVNIISKKPEKASVKIIEKATKKANAISKKPEKPSVKIIAKATKPAVSKPLPVAKQAEPQKEVKKSKEIKKELPIPEVKNIAPVKKTESRGRSRSKRNLLKQAKPVEIEIRRMPLPDLIAINYNHLKKSERPEPAKIEAQPSVLVKTEVKKAEPKKALLKNTIFEKCLDIQTNSVTIAKKAMNDAQESANEEKGSMEEKFDSFRESMHVTRDMYARQFQEGMNSLSILKRINPNLEHNTVILGSVIYTDFQNYFISVSLGEIEVDGVKFITISTMTPLFQALSGKKKGDKFKFRDQMYTIKDVF